MALAVAPRNLFASRSSRTCSLAFLPFLPIAHAIRNLPRAGATARTTTEGAGGIDELTIAWMLRVAGKESADYKQASEDSRESGRIDGIELRIPARSMGSIVRLIRLIRDDKVFSPSVNP